MGLPRLSPFSYLGMQGRSSRIPPEGAVNSSPGAHRMHTNQLDRVVVGVGHRSGMPATRRRLRIRNGVKNVSVMVNTNKPDDMTVCNGLLLGQQELVQHRQVVNASRIWG